MLPISESLATLDVRHDDISDSCSVEPHLSLVAVVEREEQKGSGSENPRVLNAAKPVHDSGVFCYSCCLKYWHSVIK